MKKAKSKLLAGLLSMSMLFSVVAVPVEALAATDTTGHWAESAINSWINRGYISGYPDGTFRPNNAISRAEFVTIANKAFGFTSSQGISFNDVKPGYWAYSEIQKGVAAGYIQGDTIGTFRPGSAVSRQEAAVMLANLSRYANDEAGAYGYTDNWAMANWAVGSIGAVSRNGIMSGYPDGTFRPQQSLTRAEAVASLQKIASSSNSFGNNNYTPPVYVTPSSNTSTNSSNSSSSTSSTNGNGFDGTILEGTRLENRTLTKDLMIPRSVGSQNVTLKNIRMKGTLYVDGGNNITLENCNIGTVVMRKSGAVLKNNGSSDIEEVLFEERGRLDGKGYMHVLIDDDSVSEVIIDADVDTLTLDAEVDLRLYANANIDTLEVTENADRARIRIGEDAEVMEMQIYDKVRISGKGKIDTMTVYVSGVRSEIEPRRLIQQDNAKKPNFNYKDDDDDDDDYENLTLDDDDEKFDGEGDKYNRVRIAAEDVTVSDLTAYDDLTITSAARDSTIRLEDVTVRGNVYIDGGGDDSVIFDNCTINGNIYSRKNTSGRYNEPVFIKLRDTSVKGDIYVTGDTLLESDEKLNKIFLNRELSREFRMDATADSIVINNNNDVLLRGSHTINSVEVASGLTDVTITMSGGKITTLTTRSPIRLLGNGTVDKLLTSQTNEISSSITVGSTETISGEPSASSYTITSSISGGNGTISPLGQQTIAAGNARTFTITANSGYHVAAIVVDNSEVNLGGKSYSGYTYTFNNVRANHSIIVSFAEGAATDGTGSATNGGNNTDGDTPSEDGYRITVSVNNPQLGGYDTENGSIVVKEGESASIVFTAANGYHVSKIILDKDTANQKELQRISASNVTYTKVTYVFDEVTENHTIYAEFEAPSGTRDEAIIHSNQEDVPVNEASGYKFDIATSITHDDANKTPLTSKISDTGEPIYYCIAGDTIELDVTKFDVVNYVDNGESLKTEWIIVNSTEGIRLDLKQERGTGKATLETTAGSGYTVSVALRIYDTSQNDKIIENRAVSKQILVDVPIERFSVVGADANNELTYRGNSLSLTGLDKVYEPSSASSFYEKQEIIWELLDDGRDIDPIAGISEEKQSCFITIDKIEKGNSLDYVLNIDQRFIDENNNSNIVEKPTGTVKVKATLPNGKGNLVDHTEIFTIHFINKVISVTGIVDISPTELEASGITTIDLKQKITATVNPQNADYKTIEWEVVDEGSTPPIATIEKDNNKNLTQLVTTGYPGTAKLKAFIKNGVAMGEDFEVGDTSYVTLTVTPVAPEISASAQCSNPSETNVGHTIKLNASVTNSDRTPYTDIKGWEKSSNKIDWTPITLTNDVYTIVAEDLNTDKYEGKPIYFRAIVDFNGTDVYSDATQIIQCKAARPDITLTSEKTAKDQTVEKLSGGYRVKGKDEITLRTKADDNSDATWKLVSSDPVDIASLTGNKLTTTGVPGEVTLEVTVKAPDGDLTQEVKLTVVYQPVTKFEVDGLQSDGGVPLTSVTQGEETTIYLQVSEISPSYASYQGVQWFMSQGTGTPHEITNDVSATDGAYKFTTNKNVQFHAVIPRGQTENKGIQSNLLDIEAIPPEVKTVVTGIDFTKIQSELKVEGTSPDYTAKLTIDEESGAEISIGALEYSMQGSTSTSRNYLNFSLDEGKAGFNTAKTQLQIPAETQTIKLKISVDNDNFVDSNGRKYEAILTIEVTSKVSNQSTPSNPSTQPTSLFTTQENENNIQDSNVEENNTQNITPDNTQQNVAENNTQQNATEENNQNTQQNATEANNQNNTQQNATNTNNQNNTQQNATNTNNQSNFVAVSDINFNDIKGLTAPTTASSVYNMTSGSKNMILDFADITSTINGIPSHTGAKVYPENASNKNITWKLKEGTLITTDTATNLVHVTDIGTFNANASTFIVNANASGTVTFVATVKNGTANGDFVKELTINISAPTQTNNTTNNTASNEEDSANKMPSNTTRASARQVVSVGTTKVGTSSVSSASTSNTTKAKSRAN